MRKLSVLKINIKLIKKGGNVMILESHLNIFKPVYSVVQSAPCVW